MGMGVVEESLVIASDVVDAVVGHARSCLPDEACGLLVGERRGDEATIVERFAAVPNVSKTPQRTFVLDPASMLAAEDAAEADGLGVVGVMHSHPTSPAVPSPTDRADAQNYDPTHSLVHLLVSLLATEVEADRVAAWRLGPGPARRLVIIPGRRQS